jgi:predicted flap endonuclease-1-like 5' DNA nuclease
MFIDVPISAIALCYAPLGIMILGFIGFATLTDFDARRTYLRDMDPRTDEELTPEDYMAKRKPNRTLEAEIPSGSRVMITPETEKKAEPSVAAGTVTGASTAAVTPTAPVAEPEPEVVAEPEPEPEVVAEADEDATPPVKPSGEPDDLKKIEGIGPRMEKALVAQGIDTFAKLAEKSLDELREAVAAEGLRFAPSAESWAEQAGYAAKGDWDGLAALQDTLISGRYPPEE